MYTMEFDIESDGDFGYEVDFTILLHEDKELLLQKMVENLRKINQTFRTSRTYVAVINECITRFLKAWDDPNVTHFYDKKYEEVWFVRNNDGVEFCFDLDNGNQHIYIRDEVEISIEPIQGGFMVIKK